LLNEKNQLRPSRAELALSVIIEQVPRMLALVQVLVLVQLGSKKLRKMLRIRLR